MRGDTLARKKEHIRISSTVQGKCWGGTSAYETDPIALMVLLPSTISWIMGLHHKNIAEMMFKLRQMISKIFTVLFLFYPFLLIGVFEILEIL